MLKKICLLLTAYCLLLTSLGFADYIPGEVLVKFKPGTIGMSVKTFAAKPEAASIRPASVRALAKKLGVVKLERIFAQTLRAKPEEVELADYYKMVLPRETKIEEAIKELKKDPNVILAQPNFIYRAFKTTPNDARFDEQWGLDMSHIQAELAWDITTGTSETLVAVIDTGVDYNHVDLSGKVDTDNDWNFVSGNNNAMDDEGHGTSVAGVIAAKTNNFVGVAGTNWHARILPLKALRPAPEGATGDTEDIIDAIDWARTHGAKAINMSLGQPKYDSLLEEAANRAFNAGIAVVAAAGNDGKEEKNYPGAFDNVLCVAATDRDDKRSVWTVSPPQSSNYGSWVDVSAPGTSILTTRWSGDGGGYFNSSGTSLATPFVSGLAALIMGRNLQFGPAQVYARIKEAVDNIDAQNPNYAGKLGTGRINAYNALAGLTAAITSPASGEAFRGTKEIRGTATGWNFSSYEVDALRNGSVEAIYSSTVSKESGLLATWDTTGLNGEYTLRLQVLATDTSSAEDSVLVIVDNTSPEVAISAPVAGATIEGAVVILGKAKDQYLDHYTLEYGEGASPSTFQNLGTFYASVESGVLGTWETAGLSGSYTLRLTAFDRAGNISSTSEGLIIAREAPTKEVQPQSGLPLTFALPNPFVRTATTETSFVYNLQGNFDATLYLFDLNGNLIWQKSFAAGENGGKAGANSPAWNGKDLYSESVSVGVYLYQIAADKKIIGRGKVIVLN